MNINDSRPSALAELLVQRILENHPFDSTDEDAFWKVFSSALLDQSNFSEKEIEERLKKFKKSIPSFLTKVETMLEQLEAINHKWRKIRKEARNQPPIPQFGSKWDHPDMIKFINSLDKDFYPFLAAERLLGISRQTLKSYAKENKHGLKLHLVGKTNQLSKEDIIKFYRNKNFKDYLPF